jgi:hypothetical protein
MSDLSDSQDNILEKIDLFLKEVSGQSLVDVNKVIDFCLDLRQEYQKDVND